MVRSISTNGLNTLAQRLGNEPVTIIEVQWAPGLPPQSFADRTLSDDIPGKIVEMGSLDNVVDMTHSNSSQQITITLDDTDGSLKALYDMYDVHKAPVSIYQYFTGLDLSDKFLVFSGLINTPVMWSEVDRTLKITVVSQIEDLEVGFSAEEGDFPYIPAQFVGKAWPMVFGTVQDCPAVQVYPALQACTLTGVGILTGIPNGNTAGGEVALDLPLYANGTNVDQGSAMSMAMAAIKMGFLLLASECWETVNPARSQALLNQYNAMAQQIGAKQAAQLQKERCAIAKRNLQIAICNEYGEGPNPILTIGGEDFPQNTPIWININGGSFYGTFQGNAFYVSYRVHYIYETLVQMDADQRRDPCPQPPPPGQPFNLKIDVPCNSFCGDFGDPCHMTMQGILISTLPGRASTSQRQDPLIRQFWAYPGARITIQSQQTLNYQQEVLPGTTYPLEYVDTTIPGTPQPMAYIASMVPGQVLAVKAFQQFYGPRVLSVVPPSYYTVQTVSYGVLQTVQVITSQPLSSIIDPSTGENQGWSDDLYVTFQSTVGPDITDVIKYLISNYTAWTWDETSFDTVKAQLAAFPVNFPLLDRKNVFTVLKEIAFQARCAIWLSDGKFYLKYLAAEPTADDTVTFSDLDAEHGVTVELTRTEDLVTKMNCKWRLSYAPDNEYTLYAKDKNEQWIVLRHNVGKYGIQEKDFDWYIYNQPDIILKCATFWLIRLSDTYKRVKFHTYLNKLNLETFDTVLFDDTVNGVSRNYIGTGPMKLVVEQAIYDSLNNTIEFQCLAPVRAGATTQDPYFWPSALPPEQTWPPAADINDGNAGGGGPWAQAFGELPVGYTALISEGDTVFVGGPNIVFGPQTSWGDSTPGDTGFVAKPVVIPNQYAGLTISPTPQLNLYPFFLQDSDPLLDTPIPQGLTIDLSATQITDSGLGADGQQLHGYLRNVLMLEQTTSKLMVDRNARYNTTGATDAPTGAVFDFKFDPVGGKLGAGTAFLQDSTGGSGS